MHLTFSDHEWLAFPYIDTAFRNFRLYVSDRFVAYQRSTLYYALPMYKSPVVDRPLDMRRDGIDCSLMEEFKLKCYGAQHTLD